MEKIQEVKRFIETITVKGIKNVIFPESFFFLSRYTPAYHNVEDQSEVFKDFHFFMDLVQSLIANNIKVHIQTNPSIQKKLDRLSIMEMFRDMTPIDRRKISESLMFYHDITVPQIASRLVMDTKPSFAIKINDGLRRAKNIISFNFNSKEKVGRKGSHPDEIVIVLDSNFSSSQREELFLGNFQVMDLTILPKKKSTIRGSIANEKYYQPSAPSTKISNKVGSPNDEEGKYLLARQVYDQARQIYNQLRNRSKEFSQSAVELKMKSDRQKEVLKNINSLIAKNLSGIDDQDLQDAKMQCKKEIDTYNQQCKDFFDLYVQINKQAEDAMQDLLKASN